MSVYSSIFGLTQFFALVTARSLFPKAFYDHRQIQSYVNFVGLYAWEDTGLKLGSGQGLFLCKLKIFCKNICWKIVCLLSFCRPGCLSQLCDPFGVSLVFCLFTLIKIVKY